MTQLTKSRIHQVVVAVITALVTSAAVAAMTVPTALTRIDEQANAIKARVGRNEKEIESIKSKLDSIAEDTSYIRGKLEAGK